MMQFEFFRVAVQHSMARDPLARPNTYPKPCSLNTIASTSHSIFIAGTAPKHPNIKPPYASKVSSPPGPSPDAQNKNDI